VSELDLPENVLEVLAGAERLRESVHGIIAIALVGSWARSEGRPDSDVDLVVLTTEPAALLDEGATSWFGVFGEGIELVRSEDFGLVQERRLRRRDGLEVEVGVAGPEWAATDPPDDGSARVVRDGMRIIFDPAQILARFARASL